jgi:nitrogen fixation-related uncharacterized protein
MGTTEIVALIVVIAAAIAIAVIYMAANTGQFEKRRRQAEARRDEGTLDQIETEHPQVDASVREPQAADGSPGRRIPEDRDVEQDRARDIAAERESHRL